MATSGEDGSIYPRDEPISVVPPNTARALAGYPDAFEVDLEQAIKKLKFQLIEQAGRLDFAEADATIRLAEIMLQKAQNEKMAMQISHLQTRLDMFLAERKPEGK